MSRRVVAVGGGHGTAITLQAARCYAEEVTAIVSVADDGGSSGRLREQLHVVAVGDIRKCLAALAGERSTLARALDYRFGEGELAGHALGNLLLVGLIQTAGGLVAGVDAAADLLGAVGRVLPATTEQVTLKAEVGGGEVNGQVAVASSAAIRRVSLVPEDCVPPPEALTALAEADQIVIGPGSLYTSILAAAAVPGVAKAISSSPAQRVYVCNLWPQIPETEGYDVADHLLALEEHGIEVDVVLWDSSAGVAGPAEGPGRVVDRPLSGPNGRVHDPGRLAAALADLLA